MCYLLEFILVALQVQLLTSLAQDIDEIRPRRDFDLDPPQIGRDNLDMRSHFDEKVGKLWLAARLRVNNFETR